MDAEDVVWGFFAWVGHATIWLVALNLLYSQPIHKKWLRTARFLDAVLVFAFPVVLFGLWWQDYLNSWIVRGYLLICWGVAFVAIPAATLLRLTRRTPKSQIHRTCQVVNYTKELGYRPIGQWKNAFLARLPGNEVFQVEFVRIELAVEGLPSEWDGLTILHLTDLHFCGTPEQVFFERVFDRCMGEGPPDLVVVTGDLVDTDEHHAWIVPLFRRLRWREAALAVLGNHDYWQQRDAVRSCLQEAGLKVLGNRWESLEIRGRRLIVVGHEGPWFRPAPDITTAPHEGFRLGLSHTPDNINWAKKNGIRLLFCGHNHGGQIRLPLFGSLFVPSRYSRRYDAGLYECGPTLMYVGRGLSGREPLRYRCRPEVTRFVLRVGRSGGS